MNDALTYRHRQEYPTCRPLKEKSPPTMDAAWPEVHAALVQMIERAKEGDRISVEMGSGGRVHVKSFTRGFH